jgi:exopolysaccharide biosynthesis polyprenyl glycosylphosphotransferase
MIPRRFFWLFDTLILGAAFLAAYFLVPRIQPLFAPGGPLWSAWLEALAVPAGGSGRLPPLAELLWIFLTMAPATLMILGVSGNHGPLLYQSRTRIVAGSLLAPIVGLSPVTLVSYALKTPHWSRLFIFSFIGLGGIGLCLYRLVLRQYFMFRRAAGFYAKNVLLIGLPASLEWMTRYFIEHVPATDYRLLGYLRIHPDQPSPNPGCNSKNGATVVNLMPLGNVQELGDLLIYHPIHEVIAIHPASNGEWIKGVIQDCDYFGVLLRIVPEALLLEERKGLKTLYPFEPLHLPAVVLTPPYWDSGALFFKRLFDIVVSATWLILLSPLFLAIAFAIKITTPHLPVFYRWRVVGRNGVEFTGYKFTTMVADADERKIALMSHNEMSGPVFKMKDDPRVTPLGRFLRKYSLNELPQFWSVLKGDMSLVGPRPAFRHELERYEFWHKRKLSIRPGITCLWQVRGRNRIDNFDEWVKMDLEYIDNWSLWLDFKILLWTVRTVLAGTGW